MTKSYICYTNYHLLVTLLKNKCLLNSIELYLSNNFDKDILERLYNYTSRIQLFDEQIPFFSTVSKGEIYIYNDWTKAGEYFRKNMIEHHLIEDGYNYFSFNLYSRYFSRRQRILNYFFKSKIPFGFSKYVKTIEVNDKRVVIKDKRYKKMIEVPRNELFSNISEKEKTIILSIFNVKPMMYVENMKSVLILTQPLYQDNFDSKRITSEADQINYFKNIVDSYSKDYHIYFKVHPRDNTDYSSFASNVHFLERHVPMELYEFVGNYHFDIGVTHSSTALTFLTCVEKKIVLSD